MINQATKTTSSEAYALSIIRRPLQTSVPQLLPDWREAILFISANSFIVSNVLIPALRLDRIVFENLINLQKSIPIKSVVSIISFFSICADGKN